MPKINIACLVSIGTGILPKIPLNKIDLSMPSDNLIDRIFNNINVFKNLTTIFTEQV